MPGVNVAGVCRKVQMSPQNYYAQRTRRQRRQVNEDLVAALVNRERIHQPRLGARKLHYMLGKELQRAGIRIGRDRMFEVLRKRQLLIKPLPAQYPHTTQSSHSLPVFTNLIEKKVATAPNQIWVSDLSYLRTREGFLYLALITDTCSRKIVGWHVGDTLEAVGCVLALEAAFKDLPAEHKPIHHSDRGSQYCCHEYVQRLRQRGLSISMTQSNHCAENALAERMNGILKQEYGLGMEFATKAKGRQAAKQSIWVYNTRRPHTALGYRVPEEVHRSLLN